MIGCYRVLDDDGVLIVGAAVMLALETRANSVLVGTMLLIESAEYEVLDVSGPEDYAFCSAAP